jgi:hypothetical protein
MSDDSEFRFTTAIGPEMEPYLSAIGWLALAWSEFEFHINDSIWELANVGREAGACMTAQLIGPGPRFRCLIALLNLHKVSGSLVKEFNSFSAEAESLGRQRNRYLHDPMVIDSITKKVHRMEITADRTVKHEIIEVEISEIKGLATKIEHASAKFDELYERVLVETPSWPRTQYEQSEGIRRQRTLPASSPSTPEHPPES